MRALLRILPLLLVPTVAAAPFHLVVGVGEACLTDEACQRAIAYVVVDGDFDVCDDPNQCHLARTSVWCESNGEPGLQREPTSTLPADSMIIEVPL